MRLLMFVLILALWSPSVFAQSLGDLARQERTRRSMRPGALLVFTSSDLLPAATPEPEGGFSGAEEGFGDFLDADGADLPTEGGDAATLLFEAQSALILQLQDREVEQQLEIVRIRERLAAPVTTPRDRTQAQVELAAAESRLSEIRTQLAEARDLLDGL